MSVRPRHPTISLKSTTLQQLRVRRRLAKCRPSAQNSVAHSVATLPRGPPDTCMARTAKTHRLTALALKKYAEDGAAKAPLHDGGGLYLRKRDASLHWVLRLTDPATGAQQWRRLFPDDRWASARTSRWPCGPRRSASGPPGPTASTRAPNAVAGSKRAGGHRRGAAGRRAATDRAQALRQMGRHRPGAEDRHRRTATGRKDGSAYAPRSNGVSSRRSATWRSGT